MQLPLFTFSAVPNIIQLTLASNLNRSVKLEHSDVESVGSRTELEVGVDDGLDDVERLLRQRLDRRVQLVLAQRHGDGARRFVLLVSEDKWAIFRLAWTRNSCCDLRNGDRQVSVG